MKVCINSALASRSYCRMQQPEANLQTWFLFFFIQAKAPSSLAGFGSASQPSFKTSSTLLLNIRNAMESSGKQFQGRPFVQGARWRAKDGQKPVVRERNWWVGRFESSISFTHSCISRRTRYHSLVLDKMSPETFPFCSGLCPIFVTLFIFKSFAFFII